MFYHCISAQIVAYGVGAYSYIDRIVIDKDEAAGFIVQAPSRAVERGHFIFVTKIHFCIELFISVHHFRCFGFQQLECIRFETHARIA